MEITAKEIERQATRVEEEVAIFYDASNSVITNLMDMENIVRSDDSQLAARIRAFQNTFINLQGSVKSKFTNLASIMHEYAKKTLLNEEQTSEEVAAAATALDSIGLTNNKDEIILPERTDMPAPEIKGRFHNSTEDIDKFN